MDNRLPWPEYFMRIAFLVAERSTCLRRKVGAVAVKDKRVYLIPYEPFNWFDRPPSFMRLLGIKWLLNLLHPDRFPVDMVAETQNFYRLFLGVELTAAQAREVLNR